MTLEERLTRLEMKVDTLSEIMGIPKTAREDIGTDKPTDPLAQYAEAKAGKRPIDNTASFDVFLRSPCGRHTRWLVLIPQRFRELVHLIDRGMMDGALSWKQAVEAIECLYKITTGGTVPLDTFTPLPGIGPIFNCYGPAYYAAFTCYRLKKLTWIQFQETVRPLTATDGERDMGTGVPKPTDCPPPAKPPTPPVDKLTFSAFDGKGEGTWAVNEAYVDALLALYQEYRNWKTPANDAWREFTRIAAALESASSGIRLEKEAKTCS